MDSTVGPNQAEVASSSGTPIELEDTYMTEFRNLISCGKQIKGHGLEESGRNEWPRHVFKPLKTSRSIRLLRIFDVLPQTRNIVASFLELDLNSPSDFEYAALSYTWGSPIVGRELQELDPPWTILICELPDRCANVEASLQVTSIPIQTNLTDFLVGYISRAKRVSLKFYDGLWIDAVCINQANALEKQTQIALMGEIYANASLVFIWLGKEDRDWEAFQWMHMGFSEMLGDMFDTNAEILRTHDPTDPRFWATHFPSLKPHHGDWYECWKSYWRFPAERTWFSRAWTFPEALLAREACFVLGENFEGVCLDMVASFSMLVEWVGWRPILHQHFGVALQRGTHRYQPNDMVSLQIHRQRLSDYICRSFTVSNCASAKEMDVQRWIRSWSLLLHCVRSRSCSLAPDKVRSTFGIANLTRPAVISESIFHETIGFDIGQTSQWMTCFFLQHSKNLDELSMVGPSSFRAGSITPSWVVDYSEEPNWALLTEELNFDTSLVRGRGEKCYVNIDGNRLIVTGVPICTVKEVFTTQVFWIPELCMRLLWLHKKAPKYRPTGEDYGDALWRTLVFDLSSEVNREKMDGIGDFRDWIQSAYLVKWLYPLLRHPRDNTDEQVQPVSDNYLKRTSLALILNGVLSFDVGNMLADYQRILGHPEWPSVIENFTATVRSGADADPSLLLVDGCHKIPELQKAADCFQKGGFMQSLGSSLVGREVFTTESDYIGMCFKGQCVPGDEVWILKGGKVPYILRPVEGQPGTYNFRGDCYVHGLMRGEYILKNKDRLFSEHGHDQASQWRTISLV